MITSASNKEIKEVTKLIKDNKARRKADVFVVEGIRMYVEIPKEHIIAIYVSESFEESHKDILLETEYILVADNVFKTMSDTKTPQGIMAIVKRYNYMLEDILKKENPLLLVLENLQDPGNLGTIIRTAEGAGVDGIIMSKDTVDIYNSKVVRATMGSIFRVPFVYVEDIYGAVDELVNSHIEVYAAHLQGGSFYGENYKKATAFLIGNEGNGLTEDISKKASKLIKINMLGKVESLNAATAATVLVYEAMRQRTNN